MSPVFSLLLAHTYFFISHSTSCAGQELSIANLRAQVTAFKKGAGAIDAPLLVNSSYFKLPDWIRSPSCSFKISATLANALKRAGLNCPHSPACIISRAFSWLYAGL